MFVLGAALAASGTAPSDAPAESAAGIPDAGAPLAPVFDAEAPAVSSAAERGLPAGQQPGGEPDLSQTSPGAPPAAPQSPLAPAWDALERGDTRAARRHADRWMGANGPSAEALTIQGRAALAEGKTSQARKRFRQALKVSPRHAPAYAGLGVVFEKKGRLDEAANEYHAAVLADPSHAEARAALERLKENSTLPE